MAICCTLLAKAASGIRVADQELSRHHGAQRTYVGKLRRWLPVRAGRCRGGRPALRPTLAQLFRVDDVKGGPGAASASASASGLPA